MDDTCKESGCNNVLQDSLTGSGSCFACEWASMSESEVNSNAGQVARSKPIWHHTKKMYQGGRL